MVNAAGPTPLATLATPAQGAQRSSRDFSFDDAVAATRRNAARALDIHGGAPTQSVTRGPGGAKAAGEAAAAEAAPAPNDRAQAEARVAPGDNNQTQPASKPAAAPPPILAAQAAASVSAGAAAPVAPAQAQAPAPAGAAIREASARVKAEAPRAPLPIRAPAQTITQFAEILARRLDGASQFDLRLDPPALGGIEGRLTLSDDGEALLSLAFDSQSAFDLFRGDEAALRSALANSGFDLSGRNLQLSFRAPAPAAEFPEKPSHRNAALAPAPLHRGAVDIRV